MELNSQEALHLQRQTIFQERQTMPLAVVQPSGPKHQKDRLEP